MNANITTGAHIIDTVLTSTTKRSSDVHSSTITAAPSETQPLGGVPSATEPARHSAAGPLASARVTGSLEMLVADRESVLGQPKAVRAVAGGVAGLAGVHEDSVGGLTLTSVDRRLAPPSRRLVPRDGSGVVRADYAINVTWGEPREVRTVAARIAHTLAAASVDEATSRIQESFLRLADDEARASPILRVTRLSVPRVVLVRYENQLYHSAASVPAPELSTSEEGIVFGASSELLAAIAALCVGCSLIAIALACRSKRIVQKERGQVEQRPPLPKEKNLSPSAKDKPKPFALEEDLEMEAQVWEVSPLHKLTESESADDAPHLEEDQGEQVIDPEQVDNSEDLGSDGLLLEPELDAFGLPLDDGEQGLILL
jgi:hypothetical protein